MTRDLEYDPSRFSERWLRDQKRDLDAVKGIKSQDQLDLTLSRSVKTFVASVLRWSSPHDAFDLIESMRLRELELGGIGRVSNVEGSATHIDLVVAVLLSRPDRTALEGASDASSIGEAVDELHYAAASLLRIFHLATQWRARLCKSAIAQLSADYYTFTVGISNLQFDKIRDRHDREIFGSAIGGELLEENLGYSYAELVACRTAIDEIYNQRMVDARDESAEVFLRNHGIPFSEYEEEDHDRIAKAVLDLVIQPGKRSTITVEDVASSSGLNPDKIEKILASFSQGFGQSAPPESRVRTYLENPDEFARRPLLIDGSGGFLRVWNDIGSDSLRRILEGEIKGDPVKLKKYDQKLRKKISEDLASRYVRRLFPAVRYWKEIEYFAPNGEIAKLGPTVSSDSVARVGRLTEADALFVIGDIAIVLEVKARSISDRARGGYVQRVEKDLRDTIWKASSQADRLSDLILENGGIWGRDRRWVDLSGVRSVHCVVGLLDDVGPLAIDVKELRESGILPSRHSTWVVSIHDLAVVSDILQSPEQFILYLRYRERLLEECHVSAVDEIDLLNAFLDRSLLGLFRAGLPYRRFPLSYGTGSPVDQWLEWDGIDPVNLPRPALSFPALVEEFLKLVAESVWGELPSIAVDVAAVAYEYPDALNSVLKALGASDLDDSGIAQAELNVGRAVGLPSLFFFVDRSRVSNFSARNAARAKFSQKSEGLLRSYGFLFSDEGELQEVFP